MEQKLKLAISWITKHHYALAVLMATGFIALTLGLGHYSNLTIPGNQDSNARYTAEPSTHLDFMSEWDGPNYLHIAKYGYTNRSLAAFFPLYPLLIRLLMFIVDSPLISALVVSWLSLTGALFFYFKILKDYLDESDTSTVMGLLLFLFFPTGVFLAATYSESLLAFLSLGAFYFATKKRYLIAGSLTGLATAAHPIGVMVIALVALLLWEVKAKIWQIALAIVIGSAGLIGYMSYLWVSMRQPLAFLSAQKHHIRWLSGQFIHPILITMTPITLALFALAIISVIYWWPRNRSLAVFGSLFVLLPLITANFDGYARYLLINFPIQFMLLNKFKRSTLGYAVVLMLATVGWAYFTIHYAAGYTGGS